MTPLKTSPGVRPLGLVQVAILRHVATSPARAFGLGIAEDVSKMVGRDFANAQIYIALRRLESKGMISSRLDEVSVPPKRGRPRRYYNLTARGKRALENALEEAEHLLFPLSGPLANTGGDYARKKTRGPLIPGMVD
jgi:PadR family transcriptional regulator, regulatory protein PadR